VVIVYFNIAFGFQDEVKKTVAGKEFQHVVKEGDTRSNLILPLAV
jgi:hypothetical protein